jgi:cytidine deaminase
MTRGIPHQLMRVVDELMICADCLAVLAYDESDIAEHVTTERRAVIDSAISEQAGDIVLGDSEDSFSWTPCGLCRSTLGGARYGAAVLVAELVRCS